MRHIDSLYIIGTTIENKVDSATVIDSVQDSFTDEVSNCFTHFNVDALEVYVEGIPLVKEYPNPESISWVLLFTVIYLALLALLRIEGRGMLSSLFSSIFRRKSNAVIETKEIRPNYILLFLSLMLSLSSIATLIVYILEGLFIPEFILTLTAILTVSHFLLLVIIYSLGWVFNNQSCAEEIGTNLWVFNSTIGIAISPLVLALFYLWPNSVNILLFLILGVFIIYYVFRITRWIKILFEHRVSIFYIILYLCALEILPLLLAYHYGGAIF